MLNPCDARTGIAQGPCGILRIIRSHHKCAAVSSRTGPDAWCDHGNSTGVKFLLELHSDLWARNRVGAKIVWGPWLDVTKPLPGTHLLYHSLTHLHIIFECLSLTVQWMIDVYVFCHEDNKSFACTSHVGYAHVLDSISRIKLICLYLITRVAFALSLGWNGLQLWTKHWRISTVEAEKYNINPSMDK